VNPLIEQQLKQIGTLIEDLRKRIGDSQQKLKDKQAAYLELTQEYWSRGSKIAVLDRNEEDYNALSEENERLQSQHAQFREQLERILAYTKALLGEFRS